MAMGNTYVTTGTTSSLILSNPAKISSLSDNVIINTQFNFRYHNERKGIIVKDFFDDVITEADYVFNQNSYYNHSYGFILNRKISNNIKMGVAFSKMPLTSFDYDYVEEVRGSDEMAPIGTADPLMGYHVLKSKGEISLSSLGFSISFINKNGPISFGVGVNEVNPGKMRDYFYADTANVTLDLDNLANVYPFFTNENMSDIRAEDKRFLSYSISLPIFDNIDVIVSYEEDIDITSVYYENFQLSPYLGLPSIVGFDNSELNFLLKGLNYNKPEKINFGFTFKPKSRKSLLFTFEAINNKMKYYVLNTNLENITLHDELFELKLGFEHHMRYRFPIRAGFQYKENFGNLDATSIFTLGTGKSFKLFDLDFAINYSMNDYKYYDIFPLNPLHIDGTEFFENVCTDYLRCNNVKESELSLLTTIRIGF